MTGPGILPTKPSHHDTGLVDKRGRKVGFGSIIEQQSAGFYARVWTTRNGETYGAWTPGKAFPTLADASVYVAKRVRQGTERYAKQFASAHG